MTYQIIVDQDDYCVRHNYAGVHMSHVGIDAHQRSKSAQGKSAKISGVINTNVIDNFPLSDGPTRAALIDPKFGFEIVLNKDGSKSEFMKEDPTKPGMTGNLVDDILRALTIIKTGVGNYYTKNALPTLRPSQKDELKNWKRYLTLGMHKYLLGCAPRWGKTIPSLLHAYDCMVKTGSRFVLYVSGKLDTRVSVVNHCAKYDFGFQCHIMNDQSQAWHDLSTSKWLVYASIQDIADLRKGELKKKFDFLKDEDIAVIIFDEAHHSALTARTQNFFEYLNPHYTIYITGTPFGLVDRGYFSRGAPNTFFYDVIDENRDKKLGIINAIDVPDITYFIPKDPILEQAGAKSFRELFDDDLENSNRNLERIIKNWFIKAVVKDNQPDWERGTLNLENEINGTFVHNAVIVCPNKIKYCTHIKDILAKLRRDYSLDIHFVMASGQNVGDDDEVISGPWYDEFVKLTNEQTATGNNSFNFLITLGRGCQSVDYPNVQAVIMLNNGESPEQYVQTSFRCKTGNGIKTVGLVIDYGRNRVLKMVHRQVEAHIDDNKKLTFEKEQVDELYKTFNVIQKTDSGFENIPLFFEDVMRLFNNGDYASDIDNYIDEDIAKSLSKWFSMDKAPVKAAAPGKKGGIKKVTKSSTPGIKKEAVQSKTISYLEQAKRHFAACLTYLPSYFVTDPNATVSSIDKKLFETMTGVQAQFWLHAITKVPQKALTKIEVEAKQIAKNGDYKIRIAGISHPVPIELANKMKSYIDTNGKNVLIVCGGVNLIPDNAKSVTYIDDNEVNCELLKNKVEVIYSTNILETLENIDMKFDCCIMNPPYGKLHLPILKKMVEEIVDKNNGKIVSLQPVRWLQDPLWNKKQGTDAQKMKPVLEGKMEQVIVFDEKEMSSIFENATFTFKLAIFIISRNGIMRYTDLIQYKSILKKVFDKNEFAKIVPYKKQAYFVPIRTIMAQSERTKVRPNMYCYGRSWLKYLVKGITPDGFTIKQAIANNPQITKGTGKQVGIEFSNKQKMLNFHKSLYTDFMRFWCKATCLDVHIQTTVIPFVNDYSQEWDDNRFYKYFNITKEEQKIIEETMEPFK